MFMGFFILWKISKISKDKNPIIRIADLNQIKEVPSNYFVNLNVTINYFK